MEKMNDIEQTRSLWLAVVKSITEKCIAREAQLTDLCPQRTSLDQETKNQALRKISRVSKEITQSVLKLKEIEQKGGIGFSVVMGNKVEELEIVVMSLLTAARLDVNASRSIRVVQDVMDFASVRNPSLSLQVRNMFRSDGKLFSLVALGRYIVLDELSVTLRESTFNRILGMTSDAVELRCEAEALVGNNKRGMII